MPLPRRDFLKLSAGAAATTLARQAPAIAQLPAESPPKPQAARPARNIIFCVADGMSAGTLQLADLYSQLTRKRPLRWTSLWNQPGTRRASCSTASADGHVTDSSAAGSAWGIGERINNNAVNFTPDGRAPEPILVKARAAGLATGCVTTTTITHATPAAFYANCPDRDLEKDIAQQLLDRRIDVALGGGSDFFNPASLAARTDLKVVRTRDELLAIDRATGLALQTGAPDLQPLLGLFTPSHMNFEPDRAPAGSEPSLAEMAGTALRLLSARKDSKGFILQIEGGRVDHAAHANDAISLLRDMLAFDDALGVALDFAAEKGREDTLILITTDHACANPGLTLYGKEGNAAFQRLVAAAGTPTTRSFDWIKAQIKALPPTARISDLIAIVQQATTIPLAPEDCITLARALQAQPVDPFLPASKFAPVLGSILANHFGVAFLSPNHTSDHVELTARGPGSDQLQPHIENTWLHTLLMATVTAAR